MKKALTEEDVLKLPLAFQTRVETIKADKISVKSQLKLNQEVENADIHELFVFYD